MKWKEKCIVAEFKLHFFIESWDQDSKTQGMCIRLMRRYMNNGRLLLPSIKPGCRLKEARLFYCKRWEETH